MDSKFIKVKGKIYIDSGAKKGNKNRVKLLPIGIKSIEGNFEKGDMLIICSTNNTEVARA